MPAHILRLMLLLISALVLAVIARGFMVDSSYYQFGNYRGQSVVEIAADEPKFIGSASCAACHAERHQQWSSASHRTVQCEVCHEPAQDHPDSPTIAIPEDRVKLCSICHEKMPGRPQTQPQVDIAEHAMGDDGIEQCTNCHNPHSPGFDVADENVEAAATELPAADPAIADLLGKCGRCHGDRGEGKGKTAALAGSDRNTLEQQMKGYRSGEIKHRMMNAATKSLSDQEITALAEFYANLPSASP